MRGKQAFKVYKKIEIREGGLEINFLAHCFRTFDMAVGSLEQQALLGQWQACNAIGMIGMNHPNGGRNHPKDPCHWDEIIPMDGGWLPHWDEALDESTGIIEAVYFAF